MLVAAGPGSGKTHVISQRIRYLIEQKNVYPGHILTITFTKAAAMQMRSRCLHICPASAGTVFGTFHSVFYHILRTSEKYQKFSVITPFEKREIMKRLLPGHGKTQEQQIYACDVMLQKISAAKNAWQEKTTTEPKDETADPQLLSVMERYDRICREQKKLDFDDMLLLCYEMLKKNPAEREKWQKRFRYILVDEFQDVNGCQYALTKLLAKQHGNLFVVGDDDQAIYSFRGSDPKYMLCFSEDFPACRNVFLEENYRCGDNIVDLAQRCISNNQSRIPKQMKAVGTFENSVHLQGFGNREEELHFIGEQIRNMKVKEEKTGRQNRQSVAVLVRTNTLAEYVAEQLFALNIPYRMREKRRCFYEEPIVRDILSVLRFSVCGRKRRDFLMFMNKPYRGIEREMLNGEQIDFKDLLRRYAGQPEVYKDVKRLESHCELIYNMDPYGAIMLVWNGLQYRSYVQKDCSTDLKQWEGAGQMMNELLERAKGFKDIRTFLRFTDEYVSEFSRQEQKEAALYEKNTYRDQSNTRSENDRAMVEIMTYHASKGLEFEHVFVPFLKQGIVPHGHMLTEEMLEEERRMFYVALTRAQKGLLISWHGEEKSLFLNELEQDPLPD